jgi:hypothetical protein
MSATALRDTMLITGAGHSGSTLLGLLVDGHPDVFYAGESRKVRFLGLEDVPVRKRTCRFCGADCPVWSTFRWSQPGPSLYAQLADHTGRSVIVDSTKNVDWIPARLDETRREGIEPLVVLLVRDGRAVVASRLRKYPELAPAEVIDEWVDQMRATIDIYTSNAGRRALVRYEELATDPGAVVRSLCDALGLEFDPKMLDYAANPHHILGGNAGTRALARGNAAEDREITPGARTFYAAHTGGIALDERWRNELSTATLETFESRAGLMQRTLAEM